MSCQLCSREGGRANIHELELSCGYSKSDYENPKAKTSQSDKIPHISGIGILWELDENAASDSQNQTS